jgi:prepilin-type N-terminal cleavage/methylation domain-containing protein
MTEHSARGGARGFTLVELLVVIAIIAILVGLLFPVFARTREKGRQTTCLSSLRQIGGALTMYSDSHDDMYPSAPEVGSQTNYAAPVAWYEAIQPQLKEYEILRCASDTSSRKLYPISYTINASFLNGTAHANVVRPSQTIVMTDKENGPDAYGRPCQFLWWKWQRGVFPPTNAPDPTPEAAKDIAIVRHTEQFDCLFADGRVKAMDFLGTWGSGGNQVMYWPDRK